MGFGGEEGHFARHRKEIVERPEAIGTALAGLAKGARPRPQRHHSPLSTCCRAVKRRVVSWLLDGDPWPGGPRRSGGVDAQVLRHAGVSARGDAPRAGAELLERGQPLESHTRWRRPRYSLQDARHLGEGARHLAHLLFEQLARLQVEGGAA